MRKENGQLTTMATRLQVNRDANSIGFPHVINSPKTRPTYAQYMK